VAINDSLGVILTEKSSPSKKGRTVGFGAFVATVVIIIVLAIFAAYIYMNDTNQYSALQLNYNALNSQYASLNSNYSSLQSQYNNLQDRYNTLNSNYNLYHAIASLQKNETIETNLIMQIPAAGFETVVCNSSYPGYIRIQFQSTLPVSFLITNLRYSTSFSYPTSGTLNLGTFIVPILDGSTFVGVLAPEKSPATVTLNITLVY
jgi:hypothetical protein